MITVSPDFFSLPFLCLCKHPDCKLKLLALSGSGDSALIACLASGKMTWVNLAELKLDIAALPPVTEPQPAAPAPIADPPVAEPPEEKRRDKTSNFRVRLYIDHNLNDPAYYTEMVSTYSIKEAAEYFAGKLEVFGDISDKQPPQGIDVYDPASRKGHHFSVRKRWQATPIARIISFPFSDHRH